MKRYILVTLLFLQISCSPSLGKTVSVDSIPEPISENATTTFSGAKIRVERFADARPKIEIGEVNGRTMNPEGDIGVSVQHAFESYLRNSGATLALFDAPSSVSGEVTAWRVSVKPGFPTSFLEGEASIRVKVSNEKNEVVYRGIYSGSTTTQHPFPGQSTAESVLGDAMSQAIGEALKDNKLQESIDKRG